MAFERKEFSEFCKYEISFILWCFRNDYVCYINIKLKFTVFFSLNQVNNIFHLEDGLLFRRILFFVSLRILSFITSFYYENHTQMKILLDTVFILKFIFNVISTFIFLSKFRFLTIEGHNPTVTVDTV